MSFDRFHVRAHPVTKAVNRVNNIVGTFLFVKHRNSTWKKQAKATLIALAADQYRPFKLKEKKQLTHNTYQFRFALQSDQHTLGLPIGKHIFLRFIDEDNKPQSRPYTPVTGDEEKGYVDVVVKVYPHGKMSQHLLKMNIGDAIEIRGPIGHLHYKKRGNLSILRKAGVTTDHSVKHIGMIAGGTGITPMLQIIRDVCRNPEDQTQISLLFANVTDNDILLKDELDAYAQQNPRVKVYYTLDKPTPAWTGLKGFVTKEMIAEHLPAPGEDSIILLCGPKPMTDFMEKNLLALGFKQEQFFKY